MRDIIGIIEDAQTAGLMNLWDLLEHYRIDRNVKGIWHDLAVDWHNVNARRAVDQMISNPEMVLLSKIALWGALHTGAPWRDKFCTPEMFEADLHKPITLWRGGGGVYDPNLPKGRRWVSYTSKADKVATFARYDGTRATRAFRLPERDQWWVIQCSIPLDQILAFCDGGFDSEVIIPRDYSAKHAKVIEQTESTKKPLTMFPNRKNYSSDEDYEAAYKAWAKQAFDQ